MCKIGKKIRKMSKNAKYRGSFLLFPVPPLNKGTPNWPKITEHSVERSTVLGMFGLSLILKSYLMTFQKLTTLWRCGKTLKIIILWQILKKNLDQTYFMADSQYLKIRFRVYKFRHYNLAISYDIVWELQKSLRTVSKSWASLIKPWSRSKYNMCSPLTAFEIWQYILLLGYLFDMH